MITPRICPDCGRKFYCKGERFKSYTDDDSCQYIDKGHCCCPECSIKNGVDNLIKACDRRYHFSIEEEIACEL